jgi:filamentous hemagglutinin
MANYFARKAGNINATDVWATTPAGTASDVWGTFTSADVLHSNGFVVTVNVSTTVGQVRNDNANSATAGGNFALANGVTLTADIYAGTIGNCVTWTQGAGTSANIVSTSINAGSGANGIQINGIGVLNITSTSINGGGTAVNSRGVDILNSSVVNITSTTINGGTANGSTGVTLATGQANITGNVNGGNNVGATASTAYGINNLTTGLLNLTGIASAGLIAAGAHNTSTGTLTLTRAKSNAYGPGNSVGLSAVVGASNAGLGVIEIQELEYGTYGMSPTSGTGIRLKKVSSNVAVFKYCDTAGAKTLIDATQNAAMPTASNVRSGVSYASGALTGTCAVPAAGSVALGVPVDNTTGTAVLTAAAIRTELAVELARIAQCSTVATTGDQIAAAFNSP